jgi:PAS domain S-box-containing protein
VVGDTQQLLQQSLLGEALDFAEGVAIFVWNEERHYVAVNQEACRLVGLAREELIGMPVGDMSPGRATADMKRVQAGDVTDGTSTFTRRDGRTIQVEWTTFHTRVAGLPYMVSIVRPRSAS